MRKTIAPSIDNGGGNSGSSTYHQWMKAEDYEGGGEGGRLDKEVVELMQEMVTEFVCFVTSDMAEDVTRDRRVALKGQDLVESLNKLRFSHIADIVEIMIPKLI